MNANQYALPTISFESYKISIFILSQLSSHTFFILSIFLFNVTHTDYEEVGSDTESTKDRDYSTVTSTYEPTTATLSSTIYVAPSVDEVGEDFDMELRIPKTTNNWNKFRLLMWKNFLLQWRHKLQGAIEILVPVIFSALLVLIRYLVEPTVYNAPTNYKPFSINTLNGIR